jgi:hypothetical protein
VSRAGEKKRRRERGAAPPSRRQRRRRKKKKKSRQQKLTCPSGVSAGHIIPQSVLCSCLGFASFPSRPIGEFTRRKCDKVEAYVSRFNTCDTPARTAPGADPCAPQLPVASEYFNPLLIVPLLMAKGTLMSRP